jgi:hypothetical protein
MQFFSENRCRLGAGLPKQSACKIHRFLLPQSSERLICSGHQPPAPIPARAAPRTSSWVTSGHPTPPRYWGHHLRARGACFCAVADRFRAAPMPSLAGRCAAMTGPSGMPTNFISTDACRQPCQSNPFPPGFLCRRCLGRLPLGARPSCVAAIAEPHRHVA